MAGRKETREEALDRLLTERGYPPCAEGEKLARELEGSKLGSRAPIRALARRGWLDWFDAEDDFQVPGRHAEVVTRLLGLVRVEAAVTDTWVPRHGRVITVSRDGARRGFLAPIPDRPGAGEPRDWIELDLVVFAAGSSVAESAWAIVSLHTGDQTACLAWIPSGIRDAVVRFVRVAEALDADRYPRPRALGSQELDVLLATAREAEAREDAARRKLEPERSDRLPPPTGAGVQIRSNDGLNAAGVCPALEAMEPPLVLALTAERVASGCPCVLGGRIFFAASEIDNQGSRIVVRALDERDGTELWVRQVAESTSTECRLFATGDRLVVNAGSYESLVLDPDSGEVLARHPVALWGEHAVVEGGICGVIPRPAEGGEHRHDLGLWSPATGAWAWRTPVDVMPWWSRTSMAAGVVVTQVTDTAVAGFDVRDGRERWRLDVGEIGRHTDDMRKTVDGSPGSIAIVGTEPAQLVVVRVHERKLIALDLETGRIRWAVETPVRSNFVASADGTLHFADWGKYCRIAAADGRLLVSHDLPGDKTPLGYNLHPAKDRVYVMAGVTLFSMRTDDGRVEWKVQVVTQRSDEVYSQRGLFIANGRLYLVSIGGRLHVFTSATAR